MVDQPESVEDILRRLGMDPNELSKMVHVVGRDGMVIQTTHDQLHHVVSENPDIFDVDRALSIVAEAIHLNEKVFIQDNPDRKTNSQLHTITLTHGDMTRHFYLLGEDHADPRSLTLLKEVVQKLQDVPKDDVHIYYEPGDIKFDIYRRHARNNTKIPHSCLTPLNCIQEIKKQISGIRIDGAIDSIGEHEVFVEVARETIPMEELCAIFFTSTALQAYKSIPQHMQNDELWKQIYLESLNRVCADHGQDKNVVHSTYSTLNPRLKEDPKRVTEIFQLLRTTSNSLSAKKISSIHAEDKARHIIAVCGARHLPGVFQGLGLENEMHRIKFNEQ